MGERDRADLSVGAVAELARAVLDQVERAVVGKRAALETLLAGVLSGGHVLVEDNPGLGKTLAARTFAQALGLGFRRIQFTPDLLPADITGSFVWDQGSSQFVFRHGPLFTGLLLADEINRTPPKTQAALLEAMQEGQVTVEGTTFPLPAPFCVIATSNPIEYEGTYPLPEAQLDRFLLRISFGYPGEQDEAAVLANRLGRRQEAMTVKQVCDAAALLAAQRAIEHVAVDPTVVGYCVALTRATRSAQSVLVGASPRGALALMLVARALAVVRERDYVVPEDVKEIAVAVLAHRIVLRPETWMQQTTAEQVVTQLLDRVPAPSAVR